MPVSAVEFKSRLESLYLAANPRAKSPHGAQTWFARTACDGEVSRKTVYAYTIGDRQVGGLLFVVLRLLEDRYHDLLPFAEHRRLLHYKRKQAKQERGGD